MLDHPAQHKNAPHRWDEDNAQQQQNSMLKQVKPKQKNMHTTTMSVPETEGIMVRFALVEKEVVEKDFFSHVSEARVMSFHEPSGRCFRVTNITRCSVFILYSEVPSWEFSSFSPHHQRSVLEFQIEAASKKWKSPLFLWKSKSSIILSGKLLFLVQFLKLVACSDLIPDL